MVAKLIGGAAQSARTALQGRNAAAHATPKAEPGELSARFASMDVINLYDRSGID